MKVKIVMFIGVSIFFLLLISRLLQLQIINHGYYNSVVMRNKTAVNIIFPPRSRILDRNGIVLATNQRCLNLYVRPYYFMHDPDGVKKLSLLLKKSESEILSILDRIDTRIHNYARKFDPKVQENIVRQEKKLMYLLEKDISEDVAIQIEIHPEIYPGLFVKEGLKRIYPCNSLASHVIGYVGLPSAEEIMALYESKFFSTTLPALFDEYMISKIKENAALYQHYAGKAGIEKIMNQYMQGSPGLSVNFFRREAPLELIRPSAADDVSLTIDARLQEAAEDLLKPYKGCIIVMDIDNGDILAMASSPDFDPNHFVPPVSSETLQRYFKSGSSALLNRAISCTYPPASIFKLITAIAGFEEKKIQYDTVFECRGKLFKNLDYFKCWIYRGGASQGHGFLNYKQAIIASCNIYFYKAGETLSGRDLIKWIYECGFGQPTGIELSDEKSGSVPALQHELNADERRSLSIGHGSVLVTPLQVVRFIGAIAGGNLVKPRVLRSTLPHKTPLNVSSETLQNIREALWGVIHCDGGTAYNTPLKFLNTAGKTGTAEIANGISPHAWFAGFYPYSEPKYAYVVLLENAGSGSHTACPVAAQLVQKIMELLD